MVDDYLKEQRGVRGLESCRWLSEELLSRNNKLCGCRKKYVVTFASQRKTIYSQYNHLLNQRSLNSCSD